ncbi:MAG: hypothetical protein QGH73_13260 [Rhodospirillales bacterium]|jgi:hypothetical protein|nr:hypothetical protein [Rhodospirillales bacterium]|tara:strand:+ start:1001 stop:1186 length:186 start_codon:yes stop_codon:yes gene_type:complete
MDGTSGGNSSSVPLLLGGSVGQIQRDRVKAIGQLKDQDIIDTIALTINRRIKDMEKLGFPV